MTVDLEAPPRAPSWGPTLQGIVRRLAVCTAVGAVLGLVVGGVGSRLAMFVLAEQNPQAAGVVSDDGFVIGQFTAATINLLVLCILLGVIGGGIYYLLRGLMIGPRWFQILSVSVGPAIVVGSIIVHTNGVDFTLEPVWLAIAMFVAIPCVYAALLTVLVEHWTARESYFTAGPIWISLAALLLWVPVIPVLGVLLAARFVGELAMRTGVGRSAADRPALAWIARAGLAVVFVLALVDLIQDAVELV